MAKSASKLLQRARSTMARAREKEKQTTHMAIEKGSGLATSVGLAMLSEKLPVSVMNIPTKLVLSGAAYIVAAMTRGNVQRALESVGDASSHIYAYLAAMKVKAKQAQPWIAGTEEVVDEAGFIDEA